MSNPSLFKHTSIDLLFNNVSANVLQQNYVQVSAKLKKRKRNIGNNEKIFFLT